MSADRPKILGRFTVSSQRPHSTLVPASLPVVARASSPALNSALHRLVIQWCSLRVLRGCEGFYRISAPLWRERKKSPEDFASGPNEF